MDLFEIIGEQYDPGEIGSVQVGRGEPPRRSPGEVVACFVISAVGVLGLYLALFFIFRQLRWQGWLLIAIASLVYFVAAYWIRPSPAMENLGWFGGLMDHPWRYSDDINRGMLFFLVVFYPGRFVSESVVDMVGLLMGRQPRPRRRRRGRKPKDHLKDWKPGTGGEV